MRDLREGEAIARALVPIVKAAGRIIMAAQRTARRKPDDSPVTEADLRSEAHILEALSRDYPEIPVISEETRSDARAAGNRFFLIDPLDGTKEFVAGRSEFTINVALIEDGRPAVGVVFAPALDRLVLSYGPGRVLSETGAVGLRPVPCAVERDIPIVLVSRSHLDARTARALAVFGAHELRPMGSALKFALLATGDADLYVRGGPTMLWDTASGQALVEAAGGVMLTEDGHPLGYVPQQTTTNPPFVAARTADLARRALRAIADGSES